MKIEYVDDSLLTTGGHLPQIVADAVLQCIRAATSAERKRCADIADRHRTDYEGERPGHVAEQIRNLIFSGQP